MLAVPRIFDQSDYISHNVIICCRRQSGRQRRLDPVDRLVLIRLKELQKRLPRLFRLGDRQSARDSCQNRIWIWPLKVLEENREGVRILRPGIGEIPNRLDADPSLPESIDKRDLRLIHLIQVLLSPRLLLLSAS